MGAERCGIEVRGGLPPVYLSLADICWRARHTFDLLSKNSVPNQFLCDYVVFVSLIIQRKLSPNPLRPTTSKQALQMNKLT